MTPSFSPERSDAIRAELITTAAHARPARRRGLWAVSLVLAGSLAGAGISTAAFAASGSFSARQAPQAPAGQPVPDLGEAVTAPPGTVPGSPVISVLGDPHSIPVEGAVTFPLDHRPEDATHVRVTLTLTAPGKVTWGTDAGGNNPSSTASAADVAAGTTMAWYDFPLDDTTPDLTFATSGGATATATMQYLTYVPTHLGVNEHGETFGVEGGPDGEPDLIAVSGVGDDGTAVEGYAWAAELDAFSPDHPTLPNNPEEALEWQAERDEKYPTGWDIRIYESDGRTDIGTFHIG